MSAIEAPGRTMEIDLVTHAEPMTGTRPRLAAHGLVKRYGERVALEASDFELPPATIAAIVGPNGSGKSTLLGCLARTVLHDGRVFLDGEPIERSAPGRVAYLPQRLRLPATATVGEVLALFRRFAGGVADRVAPPPGFVPDERRPLGQLSGGQAQRAALAATLQGRPDLVLLDEPLANLDDDARAATMALLAEHRAAGATILVASPTAVDLLAVVDRVLALRDGRIVHIGPAASFLGRLPLVIWVRLEAGTSGDDLSGLPAALRSRREGDWLALECREEDAVELLRELDARGVPAARIRIGGPEDPTRASPLDRP